MHAVWTGCCAALGLSLASCTPLVSLGSECPSGRTACAPGEPNAPDAMEPGEDITAPGTDPEDASQPPEPEPEPDAGERPLPLTLENPDFERGAGVDGDLILQEIFDTLFSAVVPSQPVFASLPGWYSCVPFTVTSNSVQDGRPADGTYITFVKHTLTLPAASAPDFSFARQMLAEPLVAGNQVSLLVDVMSQTEGDNNLYLEVRGDSRRRSSHITQCGVSGSVIGRSNVLEDSEDWQTVCINLNVDQDYYTLYLGPSREGSSTALSPKMLIDNVRVAHRCPDEVTP